MSSRDKESKPFEKLKQFFRATKGSSGIFILVKLDDTCFILFCFHGCYCVYFSKF